MLRRDRISAHTSAPTRRRFYFPIAALFLVWAASVQGTEPTKSDPQAAQLLVSSMADRMLSALEKEGEALRGNRQRVYELVEQHMLPHIDFSLIARLVLGKNWRTATPQQQKDFIREFRQFLVRFYTAALLEYTKNHEIPKDVMVFLPIRDKGSGSKVTVSSEVRQPEKARPIPVNYLLRLNKDEWKIYDVVVDGVSLVANYRASFASYVRKEGIDGLIERLSRRNGQLADASE